MKAHAWQVTTKDGSLVTLYAQGEFNDTSRLLKSGFRNAEDVRYRGEQDMPTFRGRPVSTDNAVVAKSGSAKGGGAIVARKRSPLTGAARSRLLKQLAQARKARMLQLKRG